MRCLLDALGMIAESLILFFNEIPVGRWQGISGKFGWYCNRSDVLCLKGSMSFRKKKKEIMLCILPAWRSCSCNDWCVEWGRALELIGNTRWVLVPQVSIPSFQLNEGDFLVVLKDLGSFSFSSYGNMFYPSIDWGHSCYSYVGMVMERRDCQVVLVGRINIPDWSLEVKKTWWVYRKKGCLAQVKWLKRCVVMFLSSHHEVSRIIESSDSVERRLQ